MEALKDIFVPYEIALKLKEIGFDEPCFVYKPYKGKLSLSLYSDYVIKNDLQINAEYIDAFNYNILTSKNLVSIPTWEQVKKWFREKGYFSTIKISPYAFYYGSIGMHKTIDLEQEDTYQQAQEQLILKLIEIYKNECKR